MPLNIIFVAVCIINDIAEFVIERSILFGIILNAG